MSAAETKRAVEVKEGLDRVAVDLPGVRPVEVGDRLEGAERRVGDPTLEAATAALGLLGLDQRGEPQLALDGVIVRGLDPGRGSVLACAREGSERRPWRNRG